MSTMEHSYKQFAKIYDELIHEDIDYKKIGDFVESICRVSRYNYSKRTHPKTKRRKGVRFAYYSGNATSDTLGCGKII